MGSWSLGGGGGGGGDANDANDANDGDGEPEITPGHLDDPNAEALLHAAEEDVLSDDANAPAAAGDDDDDDAGGKKQLLVSVQMFIDPKLDYVPSSLMNFVVRTVTYTMWCMLLRVAEGIRDGKMPEHRTAIESKPTLYSWVGERAVAMVRALTGAAATVGGAATAPTA
jgi:hypothetical protein